MPTAMYGLQARKVLSKILQESVQDMTWAEFHEKTGMSVQNIPTASTDRLCAALTRLGRDVRIEVLEREKGRGKVVVEV